MSSVLWPLLKDVTICHDSVSCDLWTNSLPMPVEMREGTSYLGQTVDHHGEPVKNDGVVDEYPINRTSHGCHI